MTTAMPARRYAGYVLMLCPARTGTGDISGAATGAYTNKKVDGWVADEYTMKIKDPRKNVREVVSFEVHECPEFVRG